MEEDNKELMGEFTLSKPKPGTSASKTPPSTQKKGNNSTFQKTSLAKNPIHFYSSFCERPEGVRYGNQEEDEEILLLIRRDFITNVPWILGAILLIILPIFIIPFFAPALPFIHLQTSTQVFFTAFYYLVVFGFILLNFSLWYFHVALVTNKRIVDVDLYGILVRDVTETKLDLVEDVSYTQIGSIQSLFDFGDVSIDTAGPTANKVEFDRVPRPARIAEIVGDLIG